MIDHDRLFKELIETFFLDFVDLFLPEVSEYLDKNSIVFLDKELFTDVTSGETHEVDLVVKGCFKGKEAFFLIHIEAQSSRETGFSRRMFRYFARLYDKFDIPVYPVAIFSYDTPLTVEEETHVINFPDRTIMSFSYRSIQLNQMNWRDFIDKPNPVAAALMSKMRISSEERVKVKIECLRLLATLRLDPARMKLISGFVDMYLRLTGAENEIFKTELATVDPEGKESIMQIVTSWMEEGISIGITQGITQGISEGISQGLFQGVSQGEFIVVTRILKRKFGEIPSLLLDAIRILTVSKMEALADALLDFNKMEDIEKWLKENASTDC